MKTIELIAGHELKLIREYLKTATKQDALDWQADTEKTVFFLDRIDLDNEVPMFEHLRDEFEFGMEQILAQ